MVKLRIPFTTVGQMDSYYFGLYQELQLNGLTGVVLR